MGTSIYMDVISHNIIDYKFIIITNIGYNYKMITKTKIIFKRGILFLLKTR